MTIAAQLLQPIRSMRPRYLPLLMIYFAYGVLGVVDITRDLWVKESLSLSPAELAGLGVWLALPWTIKMVFGELVDTVPILGSRRKGYVLIGAALTAAGLLTLASAAGGLGVETIGSPRYYLACQQGISSCSIQAIGLRMA